MTLSIGLVAVSCATPLGLACTSPRLALLAGSLNDLEVDVVGAAGSRKVRE